jgi:hypothetical protein
VNIVNHGNSIQATINAAALVNGYAYQDETANTTFHVLGISETILMKDGCRGMVGIRSRRPSNQNQAGRRMFRVAATGDAGGLTPGHGDPWAAAGGWQFIGCQFDGNARGQDWAPEGSTSNVKASGPDGTGWSGFNLQFAHIVQVGGQNSTKVTVRFDACEFDDNTGDGISLSWGSAMPKTHSLRMASVFRGPVIYNEFTNQAQLIYACEFLSTSRTGGYPNGTGLNDLEPFQPSGSQFNRFTAADIWYEGDKDDRNYQTDSATTHSWSKYYNCHATAPGLNFQPDRTGAGRVSTQEVLAQRCTFTYYKAGIANDGTISGSFPAMAFRGFDEGVNGTGALFEGCIIIADGRIFTQHHDGFADPANDLNPSCRLDYTIIHGNGKIMTMRNCEYRIRRIGHVPIGNRFMINFLSLTTGRTVEYDGLVIDSGFALGNMNMGGCTLRHRDVSHEGNPGATIQQICPNAGSYVAIP